MPTVQYTGLKGLQQTLGQAADLDLRGTMWGHRYKLVTLTGAVTLKSEDSGKLFLFDNQTGSSYTITVPDAPEDGCTFEFYSIFSNRAMAGATGEVVIAASSAGKFFGRTFGVGGGEIGAAGTPVEDGAATDGATLKQITFEGTYGRIGDWCKLTYNGAIGKYMITGMTNSPKMGNTSDCAWTWA